jgi:acetyltransferase
MPPTWSRANPIDIVGDADAFRYAIAMEALLEDPENDAVLVMNVPTALSSAAEAAESVVRVVQDARTKPREQKPVLASWIGDSGAASEIFQRANIPLFADESDAVEGFMQLVRYREVQTSLMATPPSLPTDFLPDAAAARQVAQNAVAAGKSWLDPKEMLTRTKSPSF